MPSQLFNTFNYTTIRIQEFSYAVDKFLMENIDSTIDYHYKHRIHIHLNANTQIFSQNNTRSRQAGRQLFCLQLTCKQPNKHFVAVKIGSLCYWCIK